MHSTVHRTNKKSQDISNGRFHIAFFALLNVSLSSTLIRTSFPVASRITSYHLFAAPPNLYFLEPSWAGASEKYRFGGAASEQANGKEDIPHPTPCAPRRVRWSVTKGITTVTRDANR